MYEDYEHLLMTRPAAGVLQITLNRPERYNAATERMHWEMANIWRDVDADPDTNVAIVSGAGRAFSAGGDLDMEARLIGNHDGLLRTMREARDIVVNMTECDKIIISAINGVAVGAGLAVALMADISIVADHVRFTDGHIRLGVAAGDHAAMLWPMMCGLAKARYYLLTCDFLDAREAERIGLVSKCVPGEQLMTEALSVATRLAAGPQPATRFTKRALNGWIRNAAPIFEHSLALEILNFFGQDVAEGHAALVAKRPPVFPTGAAFPASASGAVPESAADLQIAVPVRARPGGGARGLRCQLCVQFRGGGAARLAEELGFSFIRFYDSPALEPDVWITIASAVQATRRIQVGSEILVPVLSHPTVQASAIATIEQLAPGRLYVGVGTGFTGRMTMGQRPVRWRDLDQFLTTVKALLAGETAVIDGAPAKMIHPSGFRTAAADPGAVLCRRQRPARRRGGTLPG